MWTSLEWYTGLPENFGRRFLPESSLGCTCHRGPCRTADSWVELNWRTASEGGPYKGKKCDKTGICVENVGRFGREAVGR